MHRGLLLSLVLCLSSLACFAQQPGPIAVAGDLNGDGKPDVVVANGSLSNVGIFLNTGTGNLGPGTFLNVGGNAASVQLADFDSDGHLDILVYCTSCGQQTLRMMRGDGHGGFSAPVPIAVPGAPFIPVVADFNGDGIPDIAFAADGAGPTLGIIFGDGHGGFSAPVYFLVAQSNLGVSELRVGDFNVDGKPDLLVHTRRLSSEDTFLALNNGQGGFKMTHLFTPFSSFLVAFGIGDFNGDHIPDFLTSQIGPTVTYGDGRGGILFVDFGSSFFNNLDIANVFAVDVDGNGTTDLVNGGQYLPGNGHTGFGDPITTPIPPSSTILIAVADLNGDGKPDFILQQSGTTNVVSVLNNIPTATTITASTLTQIATSASITSTGAPVTLLAKVLSTGGTPVGTVTFSEGTTTLGTAAVNIYGWAALNTTFSTGGLHNNLNASFGGGLDPTTNTVFGVSSSGTPASISVNNSPQTLPPPQVTLTTSTNPAFELNPVRMDWNVTSSSAIPSGFVMLQADGQVFQVSSFPNSVNAFFPTPGLHNIQAVYGGDGNFPIATAATIVEDIRAFDAPRSPTSTHVSATAASGGILISATVSGGTSQPTGNIAIRANGAYFTELFKSGAQVFFPTGGGTFTISAEYLGDAQFAPSTASSTVTVGNAAGDFTLFSPNGFITIQDGQSGTVSFQLTPSGGFSAPVNFSCSNLPPGVSCSFAPATLTPNVGASFATVTISTTAPSGPTFASLHTGWWSITACSFGLVLFGLAGRKRKNWKLVLALFTLLLLVGGCGGGGTTTTTTITSTPRGTSQITVNANSVVSHSMPIQITVQ